MTLEEKSSTTSDFLSIEFGEKIIQTKTKVMKMVKTNSLTQTSCMNEKYNVIFQISVYLFCYTIIKRLYPIQKQVSLHYHQRNNK